MAQATRTIPQNAFGVRLSNLAADWRAALERRRVYKRTLNELAALSNRELADLGLHRSQLRSIAWQAAHEA
ncbi:DUF1127 domain-containing protein [Roseivivax sediminis]|uniref:DUF1127 domain-containing protein n=1 Tax=Roseivivax sediminis TaxID=936889 RepID=UPI001CB7151F|nr:DUF1127 domain-containing protein [Roseivivax sediminis]